MNDELNETTVEEYDNGEFECTVIDLSTGEILKPANE